MSSLNNRNVYNIFFESHLHRNMQHSFYMLHEGTSQKVDVTKGHNVNFIQVIIYVVELVTVLNSAIQ